MRKSTTAAAVVLVLAASLGAPSQAAAQDRVVVEERTAEVLRIVGRTVILRNDLGEVKKYHELPEDAQLFLGGEPAKFEDLAEGMLLYGVRWVNVPQPVPVVDWDEPEPPQPVAVAIYRHAQPKLDSAMRFVAETVTEKPRHGEATYLVTVPAACTLRFDQVDTGGFRVPVHVVNLSHVDPGGFRYRDSLMCFETTGLENRIDYYELPLDEGGRYPFYGSAISDTRQEKDRFCHRVSGAYSYRVWRALSSAIRTCGGRTAW